MFWGKLTPALTLTMECEAQAHAYHCNPCSVQINGYGWTHDLDGLTALKSRASI